MRAIVPALFFSALAILGCSPDLARVDGHLEIGVLGVPENADTIRAVVESGDDTVVREAPTAVFSGILEVSRAPAGAIVSILVEAIATSTVVASKSVQVEIGAGAPTRVVVNLGMEPVGGDEVWVSSAEIGLVALNIGAANLSGAELVASFEGDYEGRFANFVSHARATLGAQLSGIAVKSMTLKLLPTSRGFEDLEDVWTQDEGISAAIEAGSFSAKVGEVLTRPRGVVVVDVVEENRAALLSLKDAIFAGDFRVVLSGPTDVRSDDTELADIQVTIVFTAFAPAP